MVPYRSFNPDNMKQVVRRARNKSVPKDVATFEEISEAKIPAIYRLTKDKDQRFFQKIVDLGYQIKNKEKKSTCHNFL